MSQIHRRLALQIVKSYRNYTRSVRNPAPSRSNNAIETGTISCYRIYPSRYTHFDSDLSSLESPPPHLSLFQPYCFLTTPPSRSLDTIPLRALPEDRQREEKREKTLYGRGRRTSRTLILHSPTACSWSQGTPSFPESLLLHCCESAAVRYRPYKPYPCHSALNPYANLPTFTLDKRPPRQERALPHPVASVHPHLSLFYLQSSPFAPSTLLRPTHPCPLGLHVALLPRAVGKASDRLEYLPGATALPVQLNCRPSPPIDPDQSHCDVIAR